MAALVFGNANYISGGTLKNPVNDAEDVSDKLASYGFDTLVAMDATNKEMDFKLDEFKTLLQSNEVGLFFFAGHGMQIEGSNYLLAVDTKTKTELDAKHSSLSLDKVIEVMEKSQVATKIIILDACRNNPWERKWKRSVATRGLASVYAPKGTIIAFATSPGEVASDGTGRNGTYTGALLQHIDEPDLMIETMFKRVRNSVAAETRGEQTSWEHTSLSGNFIFNLSLGKLVTTYANTSLADGLFVIDETKPSHKIIKGLKAHDWYRQNDAMTHLTAAAVKDMAKSNLFVLGRNIYQAACGDAKTAKSYIVSFVHRSSAYPEEKRRALLDGMLFEVFFNKEAKLRPKIKGDFFNQLFDLAKHASLRPSFEFIAEVLGATRGDFYVLPGFDHGLAVTVATTEDSSYHRVDAIYVNGVDVLRAEDEDWATDDLAQRHYRPRSVAELEEELSQELVVPTRLLKITYVPVAASAGKLKMPQGYTVRKH
jgi:hypothetical protein